MQPITIILPMPDRAVSQNASYGNSRIAAIVKSAKVKRHRAVAYAEMMFAMSHSELFGDAPIGYSLAFFYKTMLFRDEGNAEGSCKAYIDGIADALKMSDRHFKKCKLTTQAKDPTQSPRVEITIYFEEGAK